MKRAVKIDLGWRVWSLIVLFFVLICFIGLGVAYNSNPLIGNPSIMGHSAGEIEVKDSTGHTVTLQTALDNISSGGGAFFNTFNSEIMIKANPVYSSPMDWVDSTSPNAGYCWISTSTGSSKTWAQVFSALSFPSNVKFVEITGVGQPTWGVGYGPTEVVQSNIKIYIDFVNNKVYGSVVEASLREAYLQGAISSGSYSGTFASLSDTANSATFSMGTFAFNSAGITKLPIVGNIGTFQSKITWDIKFYN